MDEIDDAERRCQAFIDDRMADVKHKLSKLDPGVPGECDKCGEDMPRLVEGICCPCRDKFKLR